MTAAKAASRAYDASSITVLTGLEPVRKRPGMYIGDVNSIDGLHHMLWEIVDNGIDEALAGHAKHVSITLHADGSASVSDDGRGIPIDIHPVEKRSAAEVIMTVLHAGGKFDQNSYEVSGGLHGVGASVVNALSSSLKLTVYRDGGEHFVAFERGATLAPLKRIGKAPKGKSGTTIHFLPDVTVFSVTEFEEHYHYEGGIGEMVRYIDRSRTSVLSSPIHIIGAKDNIRVEIGLEWTDSFHENLFAFTNNIPQKDHGTHVAGFRAALTRVVSGYVEQENIKKGKSLEPEDIREGMTAVVSIKLPDPKFSSQTKEKLVSSEATAAVQQVATEGLKTWLEEHPAEARKIIEKAAAAASAREASRRARDISRKQSGNDVASLPGKLADCQSKKPAECELFLVEGDSAGGSAKQARNRKNQAILPLRGKILNVERARLDEILKSQEVGTLITALGTGIGTEFDADKCRYHKIIIMTDADVDGAHIRTLLLTFFFRQVPELIRRGYVWIAQPPLYKLKSGRKERFLDDQQALDREITGIGCDGIVAPGGQTADALAELVLEIRSGFKAIHGLATRCGSTELADAMVTSGLVAAIAGNKGYDRKLAAAERLLNAKRDARRDGKWSILVKDQDIVAAFEVEGVVETIRLRIADFQGSDGRAIARLQDKIDALMGSGEFTVAGAPQRIPGPISLWSAIEARGRKGVEIQRFKGLGEMNPDELWSTTLDPAARRLLRVDILDAEQADERFTVLMGDAVEQRRSFIEEHGLEAELDL